MSGRKFDLNNAALLRRIVARLVDKDLAMYISYRRVIAAMRAENVYNPEGHLDDLIRYLRASDDDLNQRIATEIGVACASELEKLLRASRRHVDAFLALAETVGEVDGEGNRVAQTVFAEPSDPDPEVRKAVFALIDQHAARERERQHEKDLAEVAVAMVAAEEEGE